MKISDKGIVIRTVKYNDKALILHMYCRELGCRAFFFRTGKNNSRNLLQPLTLLQFTSEEKDQQGLLSITAPSLLFGQESAVFDPQKAAISFFLAELLQKSLVDEYRNLELFDFLQDAILLLDKEEIVANFHIWLMRELCKYYGISPSMDGGNACFHFQPGLFSDDPHLSNDKLTDQESAWMFAAFDEPYEMLRTLKLPGLARKKMIQSFLHYFRLHLDQSMVMKSLDVLTEVFE
jgi:DNA repair protein RecO (recombination protein O)